jgi:hypothetical protein
VPEAVIRQLVLPEARAPNAGSSLRWVTLTEIACIIVASCL